MIDIKCPRCEKQMIEEKIYKDLPTIGLSDSEIELVHDGHAILLHCICGKHLLILPNGRVYFYKYMWKFLFYKKGIWKNPNWRIA